MQGLQLTPSSAVSVTNRRELAQWRVPPQAQVKQGFGDRSAADA